MRNRKLIKSHRHIGTYPIPVVPLELAVGLAAGELPGLNTPSGGSRLPKLAAEITGLPMLDVSKSGIVVFFRITVAFSMLST
jgi:hypothetical protein